MTTDLKEASAQGKASGNENQSPSQQQEPNHGNTIVDIIDTEVVDDVCGEEEEEEEDGVIVIAESVNHDNNGINEDRLIAELTSAVTVDEDDNDENNEIDDDWNTLPSAVVEDSKEIRCRINSSTPVPHSDASLRILRKFASKCSIHFSPRYGGTATTSLISSLFMFLGDSGGGGVGGIGSEECRVSYRMLIEVLNEGTMSSKAVKVKKEEVDVKEESDVARREEEVVIESLLGHVGDTAFKARKALASFCVLFEAWCLESRRAFTSTMGKAALERYVEMVSRREYSLGRGVNEMEVGEEDMEILDTAVNEDLLSMAIDCAESLVAHGCLDGGLLVIGLEEDNEKFVSEGQLVEEKIEEKEKEEPKCSHDDGGKKEFNIKTVNAIAELLFFCDMSSEKVELSTLKFLLTAGCRITEFASVKYNKESMLRGSHLLQAIRLCYRVYLKTYSEPNKTTARAALRQIVTSAFARLEKSSTKHFPEVAVTVQQNKDQNVTQQESSDDLFSPTSPQSSPTERKDERGASVLPTDGETLFPSHEHRDAYLVLRSLCKLSMKQVSENTEGVDLRVPRVKVSSVVLTRSKSTLTPAIDDLKRNKPSPNVVSTSGFPTFSSLSTKTSTAVYHHQFNPDITVQPSTLTPALDSKILALDLLLDVLQRTNTEVLINAGPQLIYAVRNYLCHSLLKNCTSNNTAVINLSLRLFVPLIRHFRFHLKTEIEAFVTNVFFVILDSKNSTLEHKHRVVVLFEEICSDPSTLAEIFLNYDCDLSAVDLFQRIVNSLAKVAKIGLHDQGMDGPGNMIFIAGAGATRAERMRQEHRELRLEAMKAVRQILGSLHESIVTTPAVNGTSAAIFRADSSITVENSEKNMYSVDNVRSEGEGYALSNLNAVGYDHLQQPEISGLDNNRGNNNNSSSCTEKHSLVQIYDSKKKRREEETRVTLRFNQKPSAGIKYAVEVGLIVGDDPADVAQFLLSNKDIFDKTQIGEYLGREPQHQDGFALKVLHEYVNNLDFVGMQFDDAIRFFLSGFRLPGEAQKIDRIMEKFAERYTTQNVDVFPTADAAFILAFSIIMLNTDLHNPAIKEERRMTEKGFIRNNSGICEGKDLPDDFLIGIFDRIKKNPISLKEDDDARDRLGDGNGDDLDLTSKGAGGLFSNHYQEIDKKRESDFQKERDQILRNTESLLRRKKKNRRGSSSSKGRGEPSDMIRCNGVGKYVRTQDSGLKDEYVTPMYDVTWGPALAVFSTVMESANGTMGFLLSIASDNEIELAAENAASATEVCLSGFKLAIRIAALCGNITAGSAFVHALSNFSLLGAGRLLEHRHVRCIQTMLEIGRDDGDLIGNSWEYVFKALCEVERLNRVNGAVMKANRAEAAAIARRKKREEERSKNSETLDAADEDHSSLASHSDETEMSDSLDHCSDNPDDMFEEEMDKKAIDEANARTISENITHDLIDVIYLRSTTLSTQAVNDFIYQLCRVSRMEISGYGGHVGSHANDIDLTAVHYRQQHTLLTNTDHDGTNERYNQPDIYSLQKLVEVTHYNMDSRPRLVFATIWNAVSGHLTSTALHTNAAVAIYAIDSFRQLSMQFLQREELGGFEFQRRFLKPFETVMSQCRNSSVKEFLLGSVDQILLVFGLENDATSHGQKEDLKQYSGALRSGWKPMLAVIGLASRDSVDTIANLGFKMLTSQLRKSINIDKLSEKTTGGKNDFSIAKNTEASYVPIRADRFIDLIDSLLMFVSGAREDLSTKSIDHLVMLCRYLADETIPLPQKTRRCDHSNIDAADDISTSTLKSSFYASDSSSEILELWWPILLGLSRAVGDSRPNIRIKGLVTLLAIINQHFFRSQGGNSNGKSSFPSEEESNSKPPQHGDLQTLQLIFRGILAPILEYSEMNLSRDSGARPLLPEGFFRYMTKSTSKNVKVGRQEKIEGNMIRGTTWLDTTFDHLIDGCISLSLKSIEIFKNDASVEEVLAIFNNCLISDSGVLAVRGLKRLHHFVTCDLTIESITNNTWATVSHMLQGCLTVRGLPMNPNSVSEGDAGMIYKLVREEELLGDRRYIGSNVAIIIGSLLTDEQYVRSMGTHWYLFLLTGLGMGIRQWDMAASIIARHPPQVTDAYASLSPPQYAENSLYARKWMVSLLVKLMSKKEVFLQSNTMNGKGDYEKADKKTSSMAMKLLNDECESLFTSFLEKEAAVSRGIAGPIQRLEIDHMTKMVCDVLAGICNLDDSNLAAMSSLTPTLTACIQINDVGIRTVVRNLLQRLFQGPLAHRFND